MAEIFMKLLNMSITAGWLIIAVLIFRLIINKAPRHIICFMWLLVGLRLVLPVSLESMFSIIPDRAFLDTGALDNTVINAGIDIGAADEAANGYFENAESVPDVRRGNVVTALACVWLAGMLGLIIYAVVSYVKLRQRVSMAVLLKDNIKQGELVASPFVLGIIRPVIYMPYGIAEADVDYIVAHESAHIKRGDHIAKLMGFVILSVHWFNPLAWAAYVMFCKDIELACDESVIKKLDEASRKAYSTALLNCAINKRKPIIAACPVAFGEVGVKERIKSIMNYKKPGLYIVIAAVAALIVVAVCFMTDPVVKEQEDDIGYYEEFTYHGYDESGIAYSEVYRFNRKYVLDINNGVNPITDVIGLPGIVLDTANKKFHFFYDALSSYLAFGSYVIEDNILTATTYDGLYTYKFMVNGDNLVFVKEGSSSVRVTDSEILGYSIEDGSVFEPDAPYSHIIDLHN